MFKHAKVTQKIFLNETTVELTLESLSFEFKTGQYITIKVGQDPESGKDVYRAYSIASAYTAEDHSFQLMVKQVPSGIGSTYLCQTLQEGDTIEFMGPMGHFIFNPEEIGNKDILMISTGAGFAPMKAFSEEVIQSGMQNSVKHIIGTRAVADMFYGHMLETLPENFDVIQCVSDPAQEDYDGYRGRVTEYIEHMLRDPGNTIVYICGNPAMVESVEQTLLEK
ncbi:MAG: FAD-binding oxidoreductase, partial [Patescibacteria group bacterium]|nr:FAD-binding oxidoreductase [Patescibacteria group bacterium]